MRVLFLHQNFPGQFPHIASHLATLPDNQVLSISQPQAKGLLGVQNITYQPARQITKGVHHYIAGLESAVLNGQATAKVMEALKQKGFVPDAVIGHAGWGETLYVKDVFPKTKLINYFEFFYHATGADTDFDPEFPNSLDDVLRIRTKNSINLLNLEASDAGISPTQWQKSLYPSELLLVFFAALYICGVNAFFCLGIIGVLGTVLFIKVYALSNKYGQYGLMKKEAARRIPKHVRLYSRKTFIQLGKK